MKPSALLLVITLAGCAIHPPEYSGPGSVQQAERDRYECERDAAPAGRACPKAALYMKCMTARGYRQIPDTGSMWRCNLD